MTRLYGEAPSLTSLYGDDIGLEIVKASRKYGVSPAAILQEFKNNPKIMALYSGDDTTGAAAPAGGSNFSEIFKSIETGVKDIIPTAVNAVQAFKNSKSMIPASAPAPSGGGVLGGLDLKTLAIPAAVVGLVILLKVMKKKDRKRGSRL